MEYQFVCVTPCVSLDSDKDPHCKCRDPALFGDCPLGKSDIEWRLIKEGVCNTHGIKE